MIGGLSLKETDEYSDKFMTEVYRLKKGFTIMFDWREATAMEPAAAAKLEPNVAKAVAHGMRKYAWVLNSIVLKGQMKRSYDAISQVETGSFDNVEEAIKFLSE
jgi:hypothetical protein